IKEAERWAPFSSGPRKERAATRRVTGLASSSWCAKRRRWARDNREVERRGIGVMECWSGAAARIGDPRLNIFLKYFPPLRWWPPVWFSWPGKRPGARWRHSRAARVSDALQRSRRRGRARRPDKVIARFAQARHRFRGWQHSTRCGRG